MEKKRKNLPRSKVLLEILWIFYILFSFPLWHSLPLQFLPVESFTNSIFFTLHPSSVCSLVNIRSYFFFICRKICFPFRCRCSCFFFFAFLLWTGLFFFHFMVQFFVIEKWVEPYYKFYNKREWKMWITFDNILLAYLCIGKTLSLSLSVIHMVWCVYPSMCPVHKIKFSVYVLERKYV